MFTGLIEKRGKVQSLVPLPAGVRLVLDVDFKDVQAGESIAVNGVCLTVMPEHDGMAFDVSPETLLLTTLGQLKPGDEVNLERALLAGSARMGGHYVSGHVDTTARIQSIKTAGDFVVMTVDDFGVVAANKYLLPKGSITLDGISLTINAVQGDRIELMLVPHTCDVTTFRSIQVGQRLNVEFDYLARIVAHQLALALPALGTS